MPTAIFLAQAVTDSMYTSPPSPGLCSMGSKWWWLLHTGSGLKDLFIRTGVPGKRGGRGSREKSICVVGAISRKACGSSCTFTNCDQ